MEIKTTLRFHLTLVRMAIIKGNNNKCWQACGKMGTLIHFWWECKFVQSLWKAVWRFFNKLEIDLPYDQVTPLLGIYPKECKRILLRHLYTDVLQKTIHNNQDLETTQMPSN
jgi:hypothetical protein